MEASETDESDLLTANISGQVYLGASGDGKGLDALVLVINSTDEVHNKIRTGDDGSYEFRDVPPDTYDLIAISLDAALPGERSIELEVEEHPDTGGYPQGP